MGQGRRHDGGEGRGQGAAVAALMHATAAKRVPESGLVAVKVG